MLLRDATVNGEFVYMVATHYENTRTIMSHAPRAQTTTDLVEELRAIADMIEDDHILIYERKIGYEVVAEMLPARPQAEPAPVESTINV